MKTNTYHIEIKGHLDARWEDWFENLTIVHTEAGNTILTGKIADQAALHGVLKKINNLGLALISVTPDERKNEMKETLTAETPQTIKATFQQKSAGLSLFILSSMAAYYFSQVLPMRPIALAGTPIPAGFGGLVLTTFSVIIFAEMLLQIVLVIGAGAVDEPSKQQKLVSLKAQRNGYGVLVAGLLMVIGLLFVEFPAFCMANFAMLALLLAEIVRFASQLFYARKVD
jgi:hypothetical protein